MTDLIETIEDGVAILTLNRPERLNALSQAMLEAMHDALTRLGTDDNVGAILLTGNGRGFCAGGDVKGMAERGPQTYEQRLAGLNRMHRIPLLFRSIPKVVIGAINGPAFGAGLGVAMSCDLRIAASSARFGTAFGGVGYSGDFGGSWLLTQLVGTSKARELYLLGTQIDAMEAERIGLVNRVVQDDQLPLEAMAMARKIANGPRVAFGYMKANLHAAETEPFAAVLALESLHQARTGQTEDHREAVAAFNEKRKPVFKGR